MGPRPLFFSALSRPLNPHFVPLKVPLNPERIETDASSHIAQQICALPNERDAGTEQTPLLGSDSTTAQDGPPPETPLPKVQILLLTLSRLAEPLGFAILFPFVNAMVLSTGEVPVEEVGYYAGWIESLFSLVQMVFLIPWGWAADKHGRRPVLLITLLGATVSTVLFGFSTKIWHMVAFRCLGGVFGGSAVIIRTLFAEVSDSTNQARAFSYFAFASNMGLLVGPAIGGIFSVPETQFPSTFGRIPFLREYPYALPCIVAGIFQFVTFALDALLLREPVDKETDKKEEQAKVGMRAFLTEDVMRALLVFSISTLLGLSYTAILPLWLFTPVRLGGLGLQPSGIAVQYALSGVSQTIWLLFAMPPLDKPRNIFTSALFWPWLFVAPVVASAFAMAGQWPGAYAVVIGMSSIGAGISIPFASTQLMINNVTPPAHLGAVNGLALTIRSGIRTVAPPAASALFALGVERRILGRYLVWAVGLAGYGLSALAPKASERKTGVSVVQEEGEAGRDTA